MPTGGLSANTLSKVRPPEAGVLEIWDEKSRGLCFRVFPSGRKTWTFRYRPRDGSGRRRISLGDYPAVGLAEARKRADEHRGDVSRGADPQAKLKAERQALSLASVIERYLEDIAPKKKPGTVALYRHYLTNLVPVDMRRKKAANITRADVKRMHSRIGESRAVTANRTLVALSGVYTFAEADELVPKGCNPARGVERFREEGRERFLSTDELRRLGASIRLGETEGLPWPEAERASKHNRREGNQRTKLSPHVAAALRLLLFTGCRLREVLRLRWSEIDFERGLLLLPDSKTGRKPVILNAPALQILTDLPRIGEYVIAGDDPSKPRSDLKRPWDLVRDHAGLDGVRLHDLRHTHASIGAGAGLGLPIIGRLLGHRHADTTAKYAHLADDPLKRASERIGGDLAAALADVSRAVPTPLRPRR